MNWKGPHSKETITKAIVSLLIVLPITLGVGYLSFFALVMGLAALPAGIILVGAAGLGGLFNYALVVSVWFKRRDETIVAGLCSGIMFLSIVTYITIDDASDHMRSIDIEMWSFWDYVEHFRVSVVTTLGTLLSLYLLFRKLPTVSRRPANPRAPILVDHSDLPITQEATPKRGPYLPNQK